MMILMIMLIILYFITKLTMPASLTIDGMAILQQSVQGAMDTQILIINIVIFLLLSLIN